MKVFTIFLVVIGTVNVAYSQEIASLQTDAPKNMTSDIIQDVSELSISEDTKHQQSSQNSSDTLLPKQGTINQIATDNYTSQHIQEQQPHLIPQQNHSTPINDHQQKQYQQFSQQAQNQVKQKIESASPSFAMHGFSNQQQQLLNKQKLLDRHGRDNNHELFSNFENYNKQQLLQIQNSWQQQARIAHQDAIRRMQQRERKEREEIERMMAKEKLTKTQEISHRQNLQFRQRQATFNPNIHFQGQSRTYKHNFNEYMFQLNAAEFQDFQINLVVGQNIAIHAATYINQDGVYSRASEVDDDAPPQLHVYRDGNSVIANQQFYFIKFIFFEGKTNTKYLIRMSNPGKPRLFALSVVQVIDQSQISHALTAEDAMIFGQRAGIIYNQIKHQFKMNNALGIMELSNKNRLNAGIDLYFRYSLLQLTLVICACFIQVKFIEKLLAITSII